MVGKLLRKASLVIVKRSLGSVKERERDGERRTRGDDETGR